LTPQQLRQLREQLPAFADAGAITPLQREFCRFYDLDFSSRSPAATYHSGRVASGDFSLALHRWLQPGARGNLLLVHGYFDHSGLFAKLIEYGLSRNFNVLVFDLPGHGLSSGEPAVIDDFADYGHAVAAALAAARLPGLPLWVMAQSTGCAALIEYARCYPWPFQAAVMLAPLARPLGWRRGRLTHSIVRHFTNSIEREFAPNSSDPAFLQFLRRDPLQSRRLPVRWVSALRNWLDSLPAADLGVGPALIVQGDADQTVDWRYNVPFYTGLFPGSELNLLPGAGHQLANESAQLRQTYLGQVDEWLARRGLP
jgi:lysophospholipase